MKIKKIILTLIFGSLLGTMISTLKSNKSISLNVDQVQAETSESTPFYIEPIQTGSFTFSFSKFGDRASEIIDKTFQFSKNDPNFSNPTSLALSTDATVDVKAYDKIYFRSDAVTHTLYYSRAYIAFVCNLDINAGGNLFSLTNNQPCNTNNTWGSFFNSNTHIIDASRIIAPYPENVSLPTACFSRMFYECTSLTKTFELPYKTLSNSVYKEMFYHCTSLKVFPGDLPANQVVNDCYDAMFRKCTSLVKAPNILATTCSSSIYAKGTTYAPFDQMFENCVSLVYGPKICTNFASRGLFLDTFRDCKKLEYIPYIYIDDLKTNADSAFNRMFYNCVSLKYNPLIFSPNIIIPNQEYMKDFMVSTFEGCTGLIDAGNLPESNLPEKCFYSTFKDCRNLKMGPTIISGTASTNESVFNGMFQNCEKLVKSPIFSTQMENVGKNWFNNTFNYCRELNSINFIGYTGTFNSYFSNWTKQVSSTGEFIYKGTDTSRGTSAIPVDWNIISEPLSTEVYNFSVKINSRNNKFSNETISTNDFTITPYYQDGTKGADITGGSSFTIDKNELDYGLNEIKITYAGITKSVFIFGNYTAKQAAQLFNAEMANECDYNGNTDSTHLNNIASYWNNTALLIYQSLPINELENFKELTDSDIIEMIEKYKFIYGKYYLECSLIDYLSLENEIILNPQSSRKNLYLFNEITNSTWIIIVVAIAGVASIGGYFFYKRKRIY